MVCQINWRFRRFGCGTGQLTGLTVYYIASRPHDARRGSSVSQAQYLVNRGTTHERATITACTITMDHNEVTYFMNDHPARRTARQMSTYEKFHYFNITSFYGLEWHSFPLVNNN